MTRPKNSFETYWTPKQPIRAPKFKSKSKVRIEANIENKSCLTTLIDPKTAFEPHPDFRNSRLEKAQKIKGFQKHRK